ncbi:MAG: SRPBCC domain-containing protein [Bacteroidota bacterium]
MTTNNIVHVTRQFNCSKPALYRWIVEPNLISKWFGPKHCKVGNVHNNFRTGGGYEIELLKPNSKRFSIKGIYLEIDQPNWLKFSFVYIGLETTPPKSTVTISLEEISPNSTQLTLIQKFETRPPDMENRTKAWGNMFETLFDEINS